MCGRLQILAKSRLLYDSFCKLDLRANDNEWPYCMSIPELLIALLTLAGAVCGGIFGAEEFGIWGGVLGVPLGAVAGFASSLVSLALLVGLMWIISRYEPQPSLPERETEDSAENA